MQPARHPQPAELVEHDPVHGWAAELVDHRLIRRRAVLSEVVRHDGVQAGQRNKQAFLIGVHRQTVRVWQMPLSRRVTHAG